MKLFNYVILLGMSVFLFAFTSPNPTEWKITDGYTIMAKTNKFDATFKGLKASIIFDEADVSASKISASIDATSINTGNGMRNKHAMQGLEASKYPTIRFESTAISKSGTGYEAKGKLTIKDVTKDIILPFTFTPSANGGVFAGKFSVVPAEYNVTKSGTPDLFNLELNVPVTR